MNWETNEEDGSNWAGLADSKDLFTEGVDSVITIRCMEHRDARQLNRATGHGECGECIRQQCWKDILGLIDRAITSTPESVSGPYALKLLRKTMAIGGIGTFGMSDECERVAASASRAEQSELSTSTFKEE